VWLILRQRIFLEGPSMRYLGAFLLGHISKSYRNGSLEGGTAVHLSTELLSLNAEGTKRPPWSPPSAAEAFLRVFPGKMR
jgi:hypothetical protein